MHPAWVTVGKVLGAAGVILGLLLALPAVSDLIRRSYMHEVDDSTAQIRPPTSYASPRTDPRPPVLLVHLGSSVVVLSQPGVRQGIISYGPSSSQVTLAMQFSPEGYIDVFGKIFQHNGQVAATLEGSNTIKRIPQASVVVEKSMSRLRVSEGARVLFDMEAIDGRTVKIKGIFYSPNPSAGGVLRVWDDFLQCDNRPIVSHSTFSDNSAFLCSEHGFGMGGSMMRVRPTAPPQQAASGV